MTNEQNPTDAPAVEAPHRGKCPTCESVTYHVLIERLQMREGDRPEWPGVSFVCQVCHTILGVSLDPVALREDIGRRVAAAMKERR